LGLNNEQAGFVPTEEWHRAQATTSGKSEGFVIGHALNTAIGEGATRATVLQMALAYAAIANGGKLWLPQIVERVESPDGKMVEEFPPRVRRDVAVSANRWPSSAAGCTASSPIQGNRVQGAIAPHRGGRQNRDRTGLPRRANRQG